MDRLNELDQLLSTTDADFEEAHAGRQNIMDVRFPDGTRLGDANQPKIERLLELLVERRTLRGAYAEASQEKLNRKH